MNIACWLKTWCIAANLSSRRRIISAFFSRNSPVIRTAEYQATLLQRYPMGLISSAEVEALLDSWLPSAGRYQRLDLT